MCYFQNFSVYHTNALSAEVFETNATTIHPIIDTTDVVSEILTSASQINETEDDVSIITTKLPDLSTILSTITTSTISPENTTSDTSNTKVYNSTLKPSSGDKAAITVLKVKCDVNQELKTCGSSCPVSIHLKL